jgi:sRNA-binding regulator protein Hfq
VARTDNLVPFDFPVANRTIIVGTDIANGEQFSGQVEEYDGFSTHFDEQALAIG